MQLSSELQIFVQQPHV